MEVSKHFSSLNKKRKSDADDAAIAGTSSKKTKQGDKLLAPKPAGADDSVASTPKPAPVKKPIPATSSPPNTITANRQSRDVTSEHDSDEEDDDEQDDDEQGGGDDQNNTGPGSMKNREEAAEKPNAADNGSEDGTEDGDDDAASDASDKVSNSKNGLRETHMHAVASPRDRPHLQQPAMHNPILHAVHPSQPFPIQIIGHSQPGNSSTSKFPSTGALAPHYVTPDQRPGGYGPLHYVSPSRDPKPTGQYQTLMHIDGQNGTSSASNATSNGNGVLPGLMPSDDTILQGGGGVQSNPLLVHNHPSLAPALQPAYSASQATASVSHSSPLPTDDADASNYTASDHTVFRVTIIGTHTHEIRYFATRTGQSFDAFFGNLILRLSGAPLIVASCSYNCEIKIPGGERATINPREEFVNSVWRSILGPYETSRHESMVGQGMVRSEEKVEIEFR